MKKLQLSSMPQRDVLASLEAAFSRHATGRTLPVASLPSVLREALQLDITPQQVGGVDDSL
jgi:hypothetical protein